MPEYDERRAARQTIQLGLAMAIVAAQTIGMTADDLADAMRNAWLLADDLAGERTPSPALPTEERG